MKKMKKIAFGTLAALSTVAVPVVAVVSCGKDDSQTPTFAMDKESDQEKFAAWTKKHSDPKAGTIDADVNIKYGDKVAHLKKGDTAKEINAKMDKILPDGI